MSLETQPQDVNTEAPSTSETVVKDQAGETTPSETTATTETNEQVQAESQTTTQTVIPLNADLYDERGVPWKNVAMEKARKYEETLSNLPNLIAEGLAKNTQTQQQKQYSIAELEQFAQENPTHRAWVEQEKAKVQENQILQKIDQKMEAVNQKQRDETVRMSTMNRVIGQFPDLAIKDQQGNFLGWNNANPMTHAVGRYMSDPRIASDPRGLEIASKLAFADIAMQKNPQMLKTVAGLKSQLKKVQQQTFVEGGGRKVSETASMNKKHLERLAGSGSREDAAVVMRNIFKAQGVIKE